MSAAVSKVIEYTLQGVTCSPSPKPPASSQQPKHISINVALVSMIIQTTYYL